MKRQRTDNKGRVLNKHEYQIRNNLYMFKGINNIGKTVYLYSSILEKGDILPEGARQELSLREQIENIMCDGACQYNINTTVLKLVEIYIPTRCNIKYNTKKGYEAVANFLKKDGFGKKNLKVRVSDAKNWLIYLQKEMGYSYSTISHIFAVLKNAFQMAVDDDVLDKNPFSFKLSDIIINVPKKIEIITPGQEQELLEFIKNDKLYSKYYEGIFILLHTGMRISEFAGLTVKDIYLDEKYIEVNKQLQYRTGGDCFITKPKSKHGIRRIPIEDSTIQCLETLIKRRKKNKIEPVIDGEAGFLYIGTDNKPLLGMDWYHYFKNICKKYNKKHDKKIPLITPHICRHIYATKMAEAGMEQEVLKKIMGHSSAGTTSRYYIHLDYKYIDEEFRKCVN